MSGRLNTFDARLYTNSQNMIPHTFGDKARKEDIWIIICIKKFASLCVI